MLSLDAARAQAALMSPDDAALVLALCAEIERLRGEYAMCREKYADVLLAVAAEREACASIAILEAKECEDVSWGWAMRMGFIAAAIRARGVGEDVGVVR
jgi:hypothetical protein